MHSYTETFMLLIPMEDDLLHTSTHPFCWDLTCPCHEDQESLAQVTHWVTDGLMSREEATAFVAGRTVDSAGKDRR